MNRKGSATSGPYIGGQAVIEGVMMRSPACMTVAVRTPPGKLLVLEKVFSSSWMKTWWGKLPFVRGVMTLGESLRLGFGALQFSAEQQMSEDERASMKKEGRFAVFISIAVAISLFVALPQLLASGLGKLTGHELGLKSAEFHMITGAFKLLVIFGYMVFVSRIPEMRRVFEYHGAEHKTIYAYEKKLPLTVENVRAQSTLHPRCGTTFLLVVVFVAVVTIILTAPHIAFGTGVAGFLQLLAVRIAFLVPVASISYELQRLSARYCTRGPLRVLLWPGFLFQKITTREPDDAQIEVAIAAMEAARWREQVGVNHPNQSAPEEFQNLAALQTRFEPIAAHANALS